jgi:hypothetical protein
MKAHQEIRMTIPTAGSAPRSLAAVVRAPRAPAGPIRFSSLKEAMTYIKKKQIEELQDEYEG